MSAAEIDQRAMWTAGRRAGLAALQNATAKALEICLWASRTTDAHAAGAAVDKRLDAILSEVKARALGFRCF